jgi:quinol monooxygenase YgiN
MELVIVGRFHARVDQEEAVAAAFREVTPFTRAEADCLSVAVYRSLRDPRLFYVHSRWPDEAAFERHAARPHTVRLIETVEPLLDHPLDVARTTEVA